MNTLEQALHKCLDFVALQRARVVRVDSVEDRLVDLAKFLLIDKDVRQVLDSFLVVHSVRERSGLVLKQEMCRSYLFQKQL